MEQKSTTCAFHIPSSEEHKKVKKGLRFVGGIWVYLRILFHILVLVGTHAVALAFNLNYDEGTPVYKSVYAYLTIFVALVMVFGIFRLRRRIHFSFYAEKHPQSFFLVIAFILSGLGDIFLWVFGAYSISKNFNSTLFFIVAPIILIWDTFVLLRLYRKERLLTKAVWGKKYELIDAHVCDVVRIEAHTLVPWSRRFDTQSSRPIDSFIPLHHMEVVTENSDLPIYDFDVDAPTWFTCKANTQGYLIKWQSTIRGVVEEYYYFSKGR